MVGETSELRKNRVRKDQKREELPRVNFTNILLARFLYESKICSFSQITDWFCDFLAKGYWQKNVVIKCFVEIDHWGRFRQTLKFQFKKTKLALNSLGDYC